MGSQKVGQNLVTKATKLWGQKTRKSVRAKSRIYNGYTGRLFAFPSDLNWGDLILELSVGPYVKFEH